MTWMNFWEVDHLIGEFSLFETLVHQKIVFNVESTVATLAGSLEDLESSSQSLRIVGETGDFRWPAGMTVMGTDGIYLLFITLNTERGTNIISK
jgi:hypothetical protein